MKLIKLKSTPLYYGQEATFDAFAWFPTKLTNGQVIWLEKFKRDCKADVSISIFNPYHWVTIRKYQDLIDG